MRVASFLVGSLWIGLGSVTFGCGSSPPSGDGGPNSASTEPGVGGSSADPAGSTSTAGDSKSTKTGAGGTDSGRTGDNTTGKGGSSSGSVRNTSAGGTSGKSGSGSGGTMSMGGASTTSELAPGCAAPPPLPVAVNAWKPSAACVDMAKSKREGMTDAQKAAQIIIAETVVSNTSITKHHYGAIFAGGQSDPGGFDADSSANAWRDFVDGNHEAAGSDWPMLWGIDAVHGNNNVLDATMFPHNIGLGCTRNPELLKKVGHITALEMRGVGMNWTFAPTISAALDERWGRTYESFSEDPAVDAWLGQALVDGLQQGNLKDKTSVIACAKHFAGDGATTKGVDKADVTLDAETFQRLCVDQYQPLINYGVATIMISYSKYQGTSMSAATDLVTTKLKQEMGFAGIVVSDYNAVLQLDGGNPPDEFGGAPPSDQQIATAMNAGLDMLMIAQTPYVDATLAILTSRAGGAIEQSRIDDAVDRILAVKCEMGMWESDFDPNADSTLLGQIGSSEHREVARQAVRESLVVLKNDDNVLPLAKDATVLVAGTAADSIAKQNGGWTVDWQGIGGHETMTTVTTTKGTTILAGMKGINTKVTYELNAAGTGDVGVVVVGESPYAEEYGDATDLTLKARSANDDTILKTMLSKGIPVVLVIISGRPLVLDAYIDDPNLKAVVAAWLPGSEGQGVADVLFGDFKPTGKLGHSWPKSMSQIPINQFDSDYASDPPLFPVCHGLTW